MTPTEKFEKTQRESRAERTSPLESGVTGSRSKRSGDRPRRGPLTREERVELIHRSVHGDEGAYRKLVEAYERTVFLVIRQKVYSALDAEEVTQEVFVRAYFALSKLRDPSRFVGWLHGIAHNCVLSFLEKKLRRTPPLPLPEELAAAVPEEPRGFEPGPLLRAVGGLPERYRQIVNLYFLEGMSQEEIAHSLVVAPGTVRSRLHRAVGLLRKALSRNRPHEES